MGDEATATDYSDSMTERDFERMLRSRGISHRMLSRVKAEYTATYTEWHWAAAHFDGDYGVACPARRFVRAATAAGAAVTPYKFSKQPSFPVELMYGKSAGKVPESHWGAYHGAELPFVFGNPHIHAWNISLTMDEIALASNIGSYWISLAAHGSLNQMHPLRLGPESIRHWMLLDSPNVSVQEQNLFPRCDTIDELGNLGTSLESSWGLGNAEILRDLVI